MRWLIVVGFAIAACAHGPSRPDAPPQALLTWADKHPLAAQELCTWERDHPLDPTWHGHVPMPGDPAIAHLLSWASRHPDAAQEIEPPALEWTAEHLGC